MVLKQIVRERIMDDVIRSSRTGSAKKPGSMSYRVLIVDEMSMRMISACCKMHEIAEEGITIVEDIKKRREPLPTFDAVYLISPNQESINALKNDFEDVAHPMYNNIHIFFTEVCEEERFNDLCKSKCARRIKTLKEINVAFMPLEELVYSLGGERDKSFNEFYSLPPSQKKYPLERMADQIATLCATLGEYPNIRYRKEFATTVELAQMVQQKLNAYKADEPTMGEGPEKARSQLIILDRGFDGVSPLLHELTYQAMAYELLNIDKDVYRFETGPGKPTKEVLLDEKDNLWCGLRHKHIAEVLEEIPKNLKTFKETKRIKTDKYSTKDIGQLIKQVPQHQKELSMYTTHLTLSEACMATFRANQIERLCKVEQDLALGTDAEGERLKEAINIITPILLDANTSDNDKIRIILLYAIHKNGISESNLERLFQHANIDMKSRKIVHNVAKLGVTITTDNNTKKSSYTVPKQKREGRYQLSRWTPIVKDIVEAAIDDSLEESFFPFLQPRSLHQQARGQATSARYQRNWHQPNKQQSNIKNVPRIIVFIAGGLTFSEMRSAYEVTSAKSKSWDVIVGSTHVIRPQDYLEQLQALE